MDKAENRSVDPASQQMLNYVDEKGYETAFDRHDRQTPRCKFGELGLCCRVCDMGPCRISPTTDKGAQTGVCGASRDRLRGHGQNKTEAADCRIRR